MGIDTIFSVYVGCSLKLTKCAWPRMYQLFGHPKVQQAMGQSILYPNFSSNAVAAGEHGGIAMSRLSSDFIIPVSAARACTNNRSAATGLLPCEEATGTGTGTGSPALNLESESSANDQRVDALLKFEVHAFDLVDPRDGDDMMTGLAGASYSETSKKLLVDVQEFCSKLPNYGTRESLTDVRHKAAQQKFTEQFADNDNQIDRLMFGYELAHNSTRSEMANADHMHADDMVRMITTAKQRLLTFGFAKGDIRVRSRISNW